MCFKFLYSTFQCVSMNNKQELHLKEESNIFQVTPAANTNRYIYYNSLSEPLATVLLFAMVPAGNRLVTG